MYSTQSSYTEKNADNVFLSVLNFWYSSLHIKLVIIQIENVVLT